MAAKDGIDGVLVPPRRKTSSSRSWILLNSTGHDSILDFDKHAIMHRVQIDARDLRILDPLLSYPSTILGRENAIVLNLEVLAYKIASILLFEDLGFFDCMLILSFLRCVILGFQHIKAIITAEEVSQIFFSLYLGILY